MTEFKDYFSDVSDGYARYRPHYPDALFEQLANWAYAHDHAWDCATGNGQAAHGLARHFARVTATDASETQISNAVPHPQIAYGVAPAEDSGLEDASIDLILVAQAAHWFDMHRFNAEARRVLKPGGVVALVTYGMFQSVPEIDAMLRISYKGELRKHWAPERKHIEAGYETLPFDFEEIETKPMTMTVNWSLDQVLGYLNTWSGIRKLNRAEGRDLVAEWRPLIEKYWGEGLRTITWRLMIKVGRISN